MRISFKNLAVILALSFMCGFVFVNPVPAQQTGDQFQRNFAIQSGGTLVVDNYKGLIRVTGSDSGQVVVNVLKKFEGTDKDKTWWMANTQIHFTNAADRVEVSVEYPSCNCSTTDWDNHESYQASVELTIQVPRKINLQIKGYKPEIDISDTDGDIRVSSYKAPIGIQGTSGGIHVETYKETVRLKNVTIRGTLDVQMAKGEAWVEAKSLGERVNLETEKGTIVLKAPQSAGMALDYSGGRRASFQSDFTIAAETSCSSSVRGTINGGGTQVHLRSEKGSIRLEKL